MKPIKQSRKSSNELENDGIISSPIRVSSRINKSISKKFSSDEFLTYFPKRSPLKTPDSTIKKKKKCDDGTLNISKSLFRINQNINLGITSEDSESNSCLKSNDIASNISINEMSKSGFVSLPNKIDFPYKISNPKPQTSLYELCGLWVKSRINRLSNPKEIIEEALYSFPKDSIKKDNKLPKPLDFKDLPYNNEIKIQDHMKRWKLVRKHWLKHFSDIEKENEESLSWINSLYQNTI